MNFRRLGKTNLQISEIGYGSWGIGNSGWRGAEDNESVKALHRAIALGVNFIDTALVYGDGHSEQLVGQVVREHTETVFVASKVPPANRQWPARTGVDVKETFSAEHIIKSTETSLRNLGLDTIDVQQFHVWSDEWLGHGDWLEGVQRLKEQGKIRFFGVSINDHQPANAIRLIETGVVDTVQVIYNVFDQSPEDELFPACLKHDIGVIVRVPLDEGGLTGRITPDTTFPADDFRNHYFKGERKREVFERVQKMVDALHMDIQQAPTVALRYVLSHPAVSTVIPGMRTVRNVETNSALADGRGLSADQVQGLKSHRWIRNFYND
ncbi:aldo/keto reductase [Alicyclobacillaceae bacterium I2511]|nr:aldo/keto reductase [Alicyclobacillaceae bacterium I2511]